MRVQVQVLGVHVEPSSGSPIVLLGEDADAPLVLPIFVGPAEANAILVGLQGLAPPRPATHDLLLDVLEEFGAQLRAIEVTDLVDGTFIAELEIVAGDFDQRVSARPSDSIALAVRLDAPVYVNKDVLDQAGVAVERRDEPFDEKQIEEIVGQFQDFLADASASDFDVTDDLDPLTDPDSPDED